MGKKSQDAPDVIGAAREEGRQNRILANQEMFANRVDQSGPFSSTTWDYSTVDPLTGEVIGGPNYQPAPGLELPTLANGEADFDSYTQDMWNQVLGPLYNPPAEVAPEDAYYRWSQDTTLNPEWQEILDSQREGLQGEIDYRSGVVDNWTGNDFNTNQFQGGNVNIGQGDLGQFAGGAPGQTGADDWRQFGTTGQTINAGDYRQQGVTENTINAGDWRQFGTTQPIMGAGDWDARWGNTDQSGGFGDHSMEGSDWDTIQYAPEAIRQQAQNDTYNYATSRLDPQWEKTIADAQIQMRNQGLQPGDQQWDTRMNSMNKSKSTAYDDARMQSLADSRAEASMLWDQEMGRSNQKNQQTQADVDNIFRARQGNIQNYQGQRATDMQGYLDYNKNAFGQDLAARQQQLDSNLNYGQEAYNQDLQSRQQQLDAQLGFGSEAYSQDYSTRQQQLDANRMYGQQAWEQGFQQNQADIGNYLSYGQENFSQDQAIRNQQIQAAQEAERLNQGRFNSINPNETAAGIVDTFGA